MNQLQTKQFMYNLKDIYIHMGIKKDYTDWVKQQIESLNLIKNEDYIVYPQKGGKPIGGRPALVYKITKEAQLLIIQKRGGEQGLHIQKNVNQKITTLDEILKNPRKLATALLDYADQIERLEIENEEKDSKLQLLTKQSHHFTSTQVGQEIGVSAKKLNAVLQRMKYIYCQSGTWIGTDKIKSKGYLTTKETIDISGKIFYHSYWTEAGRLWLLENKEWFSIE